MMRQIFAIACISFGGALPAFAQGFYTDGFTLQPYQYPSPSIGVAFGPLNGSNSVPSFMLMSIDSNFVLRNAGVSLAGYTTWTIVDEGTVLDPTTILTLPYFHEYQMTLNDPFIMGVFVDRYPYVPESGPAGSFTSADRFGWARLKYTPAGLTLLDSAIAYDGVGIIAGTTILVPEPAAASLLALGIFGLVWFRATENRDTLLRWQRLKPSRGPKIRV